MIPPHHLTRQVIFRYALQGIALGVIATTVVLLWTVEAETLNELRNFKWSITPLMVLMLAYPPHCFGIPESRKESASTLQAH